MTSGQADAGVYFLQQADDPSGLIKIGYGVDARRRAAEHQGSSPVPLRVIGVILGVPPEVERRLHRRFAQARAHCEWFEPTGELLDLVNGRNQFLVGLVSTREAGRLLGVPAQFVRTILDGADAVVTTTSGRHDRWEYYLEDINLIARRVEERRIRQATTRAVGFIASKIRSALNDATVAAGITEAVETAIAEMTEGAA